MTYFNTWSAFSKLELLLTPEGGLSLFANMFFDKVTSLVTIPTVEKSFMTKLIENRISPK
jgi:hypothetical protein